MLFICNGIFVLKFLFELMNILLLTRERNGSASQ